jgi:nitrilase
MLVDPWGSIVSELPTGEGYVLGELDSAVLEEVRSKLPALKHRKLSR